MIPKIIHYCWFGKGLMPKSQRDCIKSWQKMMPDYQLMRWDESNFDIEKYAYAKAAYSAKKYAYVSDVARCEALLKYGGIYMDTDVEVFQRLDDYLNHRLFTAIEIYNEFNSVKDKYVDDEGKPLPGVGDIPWCGVLSSMVGCEPDNELVRDCLKFYNDWNAGKGSFVIIDCLAARLAVPYGFVYKDACQHLKNNMIVYPTGLFGFESCPNKKYKVSYHYNAASWQSKTRSQKIKVWFDKLGMLKVFEILRNFKKRLMK